VKLNSYTEIRKYNYASYDWRISEINKEYEEIQRLCEDYELDLEKLLPSEVVIENELACHTHEQTLEDWHYYLYELKQNLMQN